MPGMSRLENKRALAISERIYKAPLTAYPKEFRGEYGSQMVQAFRDLCREELGRGSKAGFVKLLARTVLDLATTALTERVSSCPNDEEVIVNNHKLAAVGFALLLLPLFFVSAPLLKYELGVGLLFDPLDTFLSISQGRDAFNTVSPVCSTAGWSWRWL
jgi:hypothetical protein